MTESTRAATHNKTSSVSPDGTRRIDREAIVQDLLPDTAQLESWREEQRKRLILRYGIGVAAALVLALIVGLLIGYPALIMFAVLLAVVIVLLLVSRQQKRWRARVGASLVPAICNALGDPVEYRPGGDATLARPFVELDMFKRWNRGGLSHQIQGQCGGRRFQMAYADLRQRTGGKNSSEEHVFNGLLFRIQTGLDIQPGLIVRPNRGDFFKLFGRRSVATGNAAFDQQFLIGPDDGSDLDAAEINRLFPAEWQAAVLALHETLGENPLGGTRFQLALKYDSLYVSLSLEDGGVRIGALKSAGLRPFPDVNHLIIGGPSLASRLPQLVDDVISYRDIIDALPSMSEG